jgi:4'-phosphopantetheinyl transferase
VVLLIIDYSVFIIHFLMDVYWLEQTEADVPAPNDWLGASESACLEKLRIPKRRADWRLGRWTAKRALSLCLNLPVHPHALSEIEIRPASSGAPEVFRGSNPAGVSISLSHRGGIAACAVTMCNAVLGCDLEIVEPRSDAFVADYFASDEQAMIARAPATDRSCLLALLWSAKESALKALREGLRLDIRSVVVSLDDTDLRKDKNEGACVGRQAKGARPPIAPNGWHPLRVSRCNDLVFNGWWQHTGELLRTVVAAPPPVSPILLEIR